jgi:uncharacterized protein
MSALRDLVLATAGVLLPLVAPARAMASIDLDPPPEGRFVVDRAELLELQQERQIDERAASLLAEHGTTLVVVTIGAMADHWPHGDIRIETFAHLLFDQWQVGDAEIRGETWNTGIMLLVSRDDRAARIQLGAGWGRAMDERCRRIMDEVIVPRFRRGRLGEGIVEGAAALDEMARGRRCPLRAPGRPRRWRTSPRDPAQAPRRRDAGAAWG